MTNVFSDAGRTNNLILKKANEGLCRTNDHPLWRNNSRDMNETYQEVGRAAKQYSENAAEMSIVPVLQELSGRDSRWWR